VIIFVIDFFKDMYEYVISVEKILLICEYHQMGFGIVVVLWPYEWKVMGIGL